MRGWWIDPVFRLRRDGRCVARVLRSTLIAALAFLLAPAASHATDWHFGPTGGPQVFVVPTGVDSLTFDLYGAQGGGAGGKGGRATATFAVVGGEHIEINVGEVGEDYQAGGGRGGYGGGGGNAISNGGGGASDIRIGGSGLEDRVLVAGGGGGGGGCSSGGISNQGGVGGGASGGQALTSPGCASNRGSIGGGGGTQLAGGTAASPASAGMQGQGGLPAGVYVAGGGGGGYLGGGGGLAGAGGGGGSGLAPAAGVLEPGVKSGDGAVFVSDAEPLAPISLVGPDGPTSDTTPRFAFQLPQSVSAECRFLGNSFKPCTTSTSFQVADELPIGAYVLELRLTDGDGHTGFARRSFSVVSISPDLRIDSGPSGATTLRQVSFTFTASAAYRNAECLLDAGLWTPCSSPVSFDDLPLGQHSFTVRAFDGAGNEASVQRRFSVETPPSIPEPRVTRYHLKPCRHRCPRGLSEFKVWASATVGDPDGAVVTVRDRGGEALYEETVSPRGLRRGSTVTYLWSCSKIQPLRVELTSTTDPSRILISKRFEPSQRCKDRLAGGVRSQKGTVDLVLFDSWRREMAYRVCLTGRGAKPPVCSSGSASPSGSTIWRTKVNPVASKRYIARWKVEKLGSLTLRFRARHGGGTAPSYPGAGSDGGSGCPIPEPRGFQCWVPDHFG